LVLGSFPYSLDCIHRILRGRNAVGTCMGDHKFLEGDPRASFILEQSDARVHFLLCLHNISSPPIRVVSPHTLDQHLVEAASEYCQKRVEIDSHRVVLPMLFEWYQSDFDKEQVQQSLPSTGRQSVIGLGCARWLSDEQKKKIAQLVGDEKNIPEIAYQYDWTPHPVPPI